MHFKLFAILMLLISCKSPIENDIIVDCKYIGDPDYMPDKDLDLRQNKVYLAFASEFNHDTVRVSYGFTRRYKVINTDDVTGFSSDIDLGKLRKCDHLTMRINHYKPIRIKVDKENQLFLVNLNDSVLKIRARYYFPGYK